MRVAGDDDCQCQFISITCNYIGTDKTGTAKLANGIGVSVTHAMGTVIGEGVGLANYGRFITTPDNVISGNTSNGVEIDQDADGTEIRGNFIGLDASGTKKCENGGIGIQIRFSNSVQIGGSSTRSVNVISGNKKDGIAVLDSVADTSIVNNYIGTPKDLTKDDGTLGNGGWGVAFSPMTKDNLLYSSQTDGMKGNRIANNKLGGVQRDGKNRIFDPNLIYNNGGLGIDSGPEGVTTAGVPVLVPVHRGRHLKSECEAE